MDKYDKFAKLDTLDKFDFVVNKPALGLTPYNFNALIPRS